MHKEQVSFSPVKSLKKYMRCSRLKSSEQAGQRYQRGSTGGEELIEDGRLSRSLGNSILVTSWRNILGAAFPGTNGSAPIPHFLAAHGPSVGLVVEKEAFGINGAITGRNKRANFQQRGFDKSRTWRAKCNVSCTCSSSFSSCFFFFFFSFFGTFFLCFFFFF